MRRVLMSIILVGGTLYTIYLASPQPQSTSPVGISFKTPPLATPEATTKASVDKHFIQSSDKTETTQKSHTAEQTIATERKNTADISKTTPPPLAESATTKNPKKGQLVLSNSSTKESPIEPKREEKKEVAKANIEETLPKYNFKEALISTKDANGANVFFAFDSYTLSPSAEQVLGEIAPTLKGDKKAYLHISGYTDAIGDIEVNKAFSAARAEAVRRKLVALGVPNPQLKILSTDPVSNENWKGMRARRVRVSLLME